MIELPGHTMIGFPLGELELVNELLDFEGNPMIVHYIDKKQNDVLGYWVDFDNNTSRWLYTKITKRELFLYLSGNINLKSVFENTSSEYLFFTDVDIEGNIKAISMITPFEVLDKYLPNENSFYKGGLSDYYRDYLVTIEFEHTLRERSLIFKGEPSDKSHGNFLSAKEGAFVLESVSKSAEAYIAIKARNKYRHKYASEARINKLSKSFQQHLTPLIANAVINSFEVWLAIDTLTLNDVDDIGAEIKSEIIEGYKKDVLDVDFTSEEDAKIICEKYDAVERKKIYGPILDMLEDENIDITISDRQKTIRETGKPVKPSPTFTNIVIPRPTAEELQEELERKKRIYTLVLSLKEGTDISRLSKKDILDNLLTFGNDIEVPYKIQSPVNVGDTSFILKKPIVATLRISDEEEIEITNGDFQISVKGKDMQAVNEEVRLQFLRFITPYLEGEKVDLPTIGMINEYLDLDKYKSNPS